MAEDTKPVSDPLARSSSAQRHSVSEVLVQPCRHIQMNTSGFMQQHVGTPRDGDMMGPLLRRKKVVSLPLLGSQGNNFFFGDAPPPHQESPDGKPHNHRPQRKKSNSFMENLIRRKQVALDLYAPSQADAFFSVPEHAILREDLIPFDPQIYEEKPKAPLEEGVEAAKTEPSGEEETERPVLIKKCSKKNRYRLLRRFTKKSPGLPSKMV